MKQEALRNGASKPGYKSEMSPGRSLRQSGSDITNSDMTRSTRWAKIDFSVTIENDLI